ncbi:hypothetical protein FACS1894205_0050 [Alphaproteobacteria bacterium]|nr:hypothetical protein FACS1894205_0050 [Alphaproteobacteria bacterium]
MKIFTAAILPLALAAGFALSPALAEERFLSQLDDLPLPDGLTEQPNGVFFEANGGRIVETAASGAAKAGDVRRFYDQSLPQLGWTKDAQGRYARENERLTIAVEERNGIATVRFSLAPSP